jgi:hypothetical protein
MIEDFPFMLRLSKHSESIANLLQPHLGARFQHFLEHCFYVSLVGERQQNKDLRAATNSPSLDAR